MPTQEKHDDHRYPPVPDDDELMDCISFENIERVVVTRDGVYGRRDGMWCKFSPAAIPKEQVRMSDIVERLRAIPGTGIARAVYWEAADEIERLREAVAAQGAEIDRVCNLALEYRDANKFGVGVYRDHIVISVPPRGPITRGDALNLAAWLKVLADD